MNKRSITLLITALAASNYVSAADLTITHYNPGENAIFPASSVLVSGEKELMLFDAQFSVKDGKKLVEQIKNTGKELSMIYISSGDPDYYFGLEPIVAAFPDVKVVASEAVVKHIERTKDAKLAYWGPILEEGAPSKIVVPTVLNDTTLTLEGKRIEVKEINTHDAYLWVPAEKTVFGGVSVYSGVHVWMADTQSKQERAQWSQSLERMKALKPKTVIPGHYLGDMPKGVEGVQFTINYIADIEQTLEKSSKPSSSEISAAMKAKYPQFAATEGDLELGAKVLSGEMEWH
ncbi:Vmh family MBL fold metallo-hydrolase [Vibrio harveyi]|uniref:Vmh family MBL fold metallo-hydrolase n=1 Tax=Vibrio harveyi TaxID=669 RepID=UPI00234C4F53|nr:Vmh family MBL fold metallo-hydrolase [Vibrio harveyi]EKO3802172.1 MBL fold metallo-hydrolase [Vibrio harveyi]EKO3853792.1 MBL fold metallo-hydrolase [Vibrio harveyi]ELH4836611.1 MBL fold metallo-hydrolase [Vibrio harveyi]ELI0633498.1 MBL fold metallo-hydrolase [Vibrio harveyi]WCP84086.1 Vmh family MBL fold metallo-hydrolase [Vibrio harveyi]